MILLTNSQSFHKIYPFFPVSIQAQKLMLGEGSIIVFDCTFKLLGGRLFSRLVATSAVMMFVTPRFLAALMSLGPVIE